MSERKETIGRTLLVALVLCVVCSTVVATAAVMLRPMQSEAQERDRATNILQIAGIYQPGVPLEQQMEAVTPRVIDLETGRFTDELTPAQVIEPRKLAKDPEFSIDLGGQQDLAKIGRRENYSLVYLVEKDGELDRIILPVRGYGLWSTLWGYLALEGDANTVIGLGFYQHAETPGLGGEVDNPRWRAQWPGKKIYQDGEVAIQVVKGQAPDGATFQVDGLSGATLTTHGVDAMLKFWMGEQGYAKFLQNLTEGEA